MNSLVRCAPISMVVCVAAVGCTPLRFEDGVRFYADQFGVRDASSRRVRGGAWNLRFDNLMISDLDEAIAIEDPESMRRAGLEVLRAADRLGRNAFSGEVDRMPPEGRARLAALAGCEPTADALKTAFAARADNALATLVQRITSESSEWARWTLQTLRHDIEQAIDDQGRVARQVMFSWAGPPVWIALEMEEARTEEKASNNLAKRFQRVVRWEPSRTDAQGWAARFAPTIEMEWPVHRAYPQDYDRLGAVELSAGVDGGEDEVRIDVSQPAVYVYRSETKTHGRRHEQIVYVWWYPERPAMKEDDPSAGHIDGNTLRVTLDSNGRPAIFEVMSNCGCGHRVFVDRRVEEAACRDYGEPEPGKRFCVSRAGAGRYDVVVADVVDVPSDGRGMSVSVDAGYHEVCRVDWLNEGPKVIETLAYALRDYDELDRLPLGDGIGSMFGSDGLVHFAGRPEGYLLAPTGMLSAGQPRKRGTQQIRWDSFKFDDPHLLERTLRLPEDF